jgi:hypothetical protein
LANADFKKNDSEDKTKAFATLLKAYQEEVDNLTKRAKYGENAFLNVYQKLYEAPDPLPALVSSDVSFWHLRDCALESFCFKIALLGRIYWFRRQSGLCYHLRIGTLKPMCCRACSRDTYFSGVLRFEQFV